MAWSHTLLRNGRFWLDAGSMFGIIPRVVWTRWLDPDDKNRMPLQQNSLLLENNGRLVVIEAGIGDKFDEKTRALYDQEPRAIHDALAEIGRDPADVSAVILTHLHFDHAGGITRRGSNGEPVLTFPNAEIIVQRQEWEDAIANKSTMHKTYLRDHLTDDVARRVRLIEGIEEVLPDITVFPTPGHTWGQQCVRFIGADGTTRVFVSDVMPTRLHARPTTNLSYDVESYTSMVQRRELLQRAADRGWVLTLVHEPGPPEFRVGHDPEKPGEFVLKPVGA